MIELLLPLLIGLSAFFSSAEIALASVSRAKASVLAKRVKDVLWLKERQEDVVIAILIGNNVVNLLASSIATVTLYNLFGDAAVALATGIMTFLLLTFGEIIPKALAIRFSSTYLMRIAPILKALTIALWPLIAFYKALLKLLEKLLKGREEDHYEEEIEYMLREGHEKGRISRYERAIIERVFDLDESSIEELMVPIEKAFALEENLTVGEAVERVKGVPYNDILLYRHRRENVTGIVDVRKLYRKALEDPQALLRELKEPPLLAHAGERATALLKRMKDARKDFAVVMGSDRKAKGIITMDDLLEWMVEGL